MTRYISWQDVAERYADATRPQGGSEATKASFIAGAEDEVDGRLAVKYSVPFTPVPGVVKDLCVDLAYYKMVMRQDDKAKPLKAYLDARFADILAGKLVLVTSGTVLGSNEQAWSTEQDFESSFGVDPSERWAVDSNWQDSFAAARGWPQP